jgi:hypothetical protein
MLFIALDMGCLTELCVLQLGTLLRSKRKLEELSNVIQESRRAAH